MATASERMHHKFGLYFLFLFVGVVFFSCQEDYTPKPTAYPRLELPQKGYEQYPNDGCPFKFEKPTYTKVDKNPRISFKSKDDQCWMNLDFESLGAKIHMSYKSIPSRDVLRKLIEDDYKLTAKHMKKAEYIDKREIASTNGVYGLFADVGGDAASHMQFFLTDSSQHFLRGSLYFNSTPNFDSIRPAVDFIKADLLHMIDTFEWKEE